MANGRHGQARPRPADPGPVDGQGEAGNSTGQQTDGTTKGLIVLALLAAICIAAFYQILYTTVGAIITAVVALLPFLETARRLTGDHEFYIPRWIPVAVLVINALAAAALLGLLWYQANRDYMVTSTVILRNDATENTPLKTAAPDLPRGGVATVTADIGQGPEVTRSYLILSFKIDDANPGQDICAPYTTVHLQPGQAGYVGTSDDARQRDPSKPFRLIVELPKPVASTEVVVQVARDRPGTENCLIDLSVTEARFAVSNPLGAES